MKKSFIKKGLCFLIGLCFCLSVFAIPSTVVKAGKSEQKVVSEDMYGEELSNQKWFRTNDISHEQGKIVFEKSKTDASSKIVSVILASDLRAMGIDSSLNGTVTFKVTDSLDGEFYTAFGLERPYSEINTASAICFFDNNGKVGVKVVNFSGEVGDVYVAQTSYAYGEEIVVDFNVYAVGSLYLAINGVSLINHDNAIKVNGMGYFGFGQSAGSSVEIYNAEVRSASYDTPTNANIDETFSDGFNNILLYSEGGGSGYFTPEKVVCEDGVLKFTNVTVTGFITTRHEFSNFTMTYDIPHIQRVAEKDSDGNVIIPATNWMGISIGCSTMKASSAIAVAQSLFFYMMPVYDVNTGKATNMSCVLLSNYNIVKTATIGDEHNFFNPEHAIDVEGKERVVNIKVNMLDGILQVYAKYADEPVGKYFKIIEYNLGYTPLGYLQIWGYGDDFNYVQNNMANGRESYCANFWIDNLKIENKDAQANTFEAGFVSSKFPHQEDYVYVDMWDNRMDTLYSADVPVEESTSSEGCGASVGAVPFMLLGLLGGVVAIAKRRKDV